MGHVEILEMIRIRCREARGKTETHQVTEEAATADIVAPSGYFTFSLARFVLRDKELCEEAGGIGGREFVRCPSPVVGRGTV